MSERGANAFPSDLALQMTTAGSPPGEDFILWYEVNSRRQGFKLSVEALQQCEIAEGLLDACIYFNNFFVNCNIDSDSHYCAADVKRIRQGEGRSNVARSWNVRNRVFKKRGNGSVVDKPWGGSHNQLGTSTHKALLPLLSGELPQKHLPFLGREVDEVYLREVGVCLDELTKAFDSRESLEVLEDKRPLIEKLHLLLAEVLAPHTQHLKGAKDLRDEYTRSLFLRSWGYMFLYALRERRACPIFREIRLPRVKIFTGGKRVTPGIVDGIWVDKVEGNPLGPEEKRFLWELSATGIRSFDRLMKVLGEHFRGRPLSLGILELKSLGESYRQLLKPADVEVGPRPLDKRQTLMYGAFMDYYLKEEMKFPGAVRKIEWIYAFAQPPISYREDLTQEEITGYIEGLRADELILESHAIVRKKEAKLYDHVTKLLDSNGSTKIQVINPSLII